MIEKYGESKSNTEVFRLLAEAMGFDDEPLKDSDEEMIRQALDYPDNPWLDGIDYDSLTEKHFVKANRKTVFPDKLPRAIAVARPIPLPPPVIRAVLFCKDCI